MARKATRGHAVILVILVSLRHIAGQQVQRGFLGGRQFLVMLGPYPRRLILPRLGLPWCVESTPQVFESVYANAAIPLLRLRRSSTGPSPFDVRMRWRKH